VTAQASATGARRAVAEPGERLQVAGVRGVAQQRDPQQEAAEQEDGGEDRGHAGARALARLPDELLLSIVGHRGHGDGDPKPRPDVTVADPARRLGIDLVAPGHARDLLPGEEDEIEDGRGEADQRLEPAPHCELTSGAMRHGGRL
jgi:hypothetical protein